MTARRLFLALASALLLATGCATGPSPQDTHPPIVFVHGNGDSASIWQPTIWRFESNGWPRERLHAIDMPLALARDDNAKPQPGRSSTADHMDFVKSEVEKVLARTGAKQVVLVGLSRGTMGVRDYVQNGGGDKVTSHVVLGGTYSHGIWAVPIEGLTDTSEFAGHGPFIQGLNRPKNANGDEVTTPPKWLVIRSDSNDKYQQPDGLWVGKRGVATGVTPTSAELKGATNVVLPRVDHREAAVGPAAFEAMYRFITGAAPRTVAITPEERVVLSGKVNGAGTNIGLAGARLEVFAIDPITGERRGNALYSKVVAEDGSWGLFQAERETRYEFAVTAPGYAVTHFYRSPFPRSSTVVNMRPERVPEADKNAPALAIMARPRGYLDPARDKMGFDGQSPPPGAVLGAGVASSRLKPTGLPRPIVAEFNGERVVGRTWPLAENHVSVLELTY
jgi:pimeloyl-ACP methyl ester carboxylesterase